VSDAGRGLVSRFRSSPQFAASPGASFGIEEHQQLYDFGAVLNLKFLNEFAASYRNFKFTALARCSDWATHFRKNASALTFH
jgi:hypothetical protein